MARQCYRVKSWRTESSLSALTVIVDGTVHPAYTNLEAVLQSALLGATVTLFEAEGFGGLHLGTEATFEVSQSAANADLQSILGHARTLISICDDCNVSHCLDLYRVPEETATSPEEWTYTEVGMLLFEAKYRSNRHATAELAARLLEVVKTHPCYRRAELVCPMPASSQRGGPNLPRDWALEISKDIGVPILALNRTRQVASQKGITDPSQRKANQAGSMVAQERAVNRSVLLLDDLYMEGETVSEATRALRAAGASEVFSLCCVKTAKGAYGLPNLLE